MTKATRQMIDDKSAELTRTRAELAAMLAGPAKTEALERSRPARISEATRRVGELEGRIARLIGGAK